MPIPYSRVKQILETSQKATYSWWRDYPTFTEIVTMSHASVLNEMRSLIECGYCKRLGRYGSRCEGCGAQVKP